MTTKLCFDCGKETECKTEWRDVDEYTKTMVNICKDGCFKENKQNE